MEWLNIRTSTLHSPEYIGSGPCERATWFNVSMWCAQQENSGRIKGARAWKDRQWQQTCGVSKREVDNAKILLPWVGDDLTVWNYPIAKQEEVLAKREAGKVTAAKRWTKPNSSQNSSQDSSATSLPGSSPDAEGKGRGKEEEGKGKESKQAPVPVASVASENPPPPPPPPRPKAKRERNPIIDALAACGGADPLQVTPRAWPGIAAALADIVAVCPDVTPEEIRRRSSNYRTHMRDTILTPHALAKNWALCEKPNENERGNNRVGTMTPKDHELGF